MSSRRRIIAVVVGAVAALAIVGIVVALTLPRDEPVAAPTPTVSAPAPEPTPTPTVDEGPAENTETYDAAALPVLDVFTVNAALPIDDDPMGELTGEVALPAGVAPVFPDPTAAPVAALPRDGVYGGASVPIIEKHTHWVRVLLVGRNAAPSPGQLTGWMRAADVEVSPVGSSVHVDLAARTIDIVTDGVPERVADDFGWGTAATPTPLGRTFVMMTQVTNFSYTRGHPVTYLASQSSTLAGFDGASVAITAFHYHDAHSGSISNGCLRLDAAASDRIGQLPAGTPVVVTG